MKNRKMNELRVIPRGLMPRTNGEAARPGEAGLAQNLREREESLQVTGQPTAIAAIGGDERLLTMSGDHVVSCRADGTVLIDGEVVARVDSQVVAAHAIGTMMVIVARGGLTYLLPDGDGWIVLNPADAVPQLSFGVSTQVSHAEISAVDFAEPYSQWRAPLAEADRLTLAGMLRSAWNALESDAHAQGRHTAPMLVRWAVRLLDDTYLWVSDPVRVGDVTLANANRISTLVDSGSSGFTGTQATSLPMMNYSLTIGMTSAIAAPWQALVKSIDVLATNEAQLLSASRELDYRCLTRTSGTREYVLEMGLARRSADAISWELAASPWRLIATASAASQPGTASFTVPVEMMKLTAAQCAALASPMTVDNVVCSTAAGGRLYCCTAAGEVVVSAPGNALIEVHRRSVLGAKPLAMAVVTRPLYSGGFGRYPVYVFTDDGIYAIPQRASDRLGEARLVDRTVIAAGVAPVEGDGDIWLMSRHGHLCRLSGSRLTVVCRDVAAGQFYSDARHSLAVTATGAVLDLEQEQPAMMDVAWFSHPVSLDALMDHPVKRAVWHVVSDDAGLSLRIRGQRGIMSQDRDVSLITMHGAIDQPLASPTMSIHARTLTFTLDGTARTGTLLMPTIVYYS